MAYRVAIVDDSTTDAEFMDTTRSRISTSNPLRQSKCCDLFQAIVFFNAFFAHYFSFYFNCANGCK